MRRGNASIRFETRPSRPPSPPFGQWHGFSICPNVKIVDEMWDGRERGIEHTFARLINLFIECEWKFWKGWRLPLFLLKNWEHHRLIGKFIYLIKYEWNWEYLKYVCIDLLSKITDKKKLHRYTFDINQIWVKYFKWQSDIFLNFCSF